MLSFMKFLGTKTRRGARRADVFASEVKGTAALVCGRDRAPFILWNLSHDGLRLWTPMRVSEGETLVITIAQPALVRLEAQVCWSRSEDAGRGYHVGLKVLGDRKRLELLGTTLGAGKAALA